MAKQELILFNRSWLIPLLLCVSSATFALNPSEDDFELKLLGKFVFFDEISRPKGIMSCATCHDPVAGWTGPESDVNFHQVAMEGAKEGRFGTLKPPTNAYTSFIQPFTLEGRAFRGGHFWNGRAEGKAPQDFPLNATRHIGEEVFYKANGNLITKVNVSEYAKYFGPISDQALNPMPNPVEQNIDRKAVCKHVKRSPYAALYKMVWGVKIKCNNREVAYQANDQSVTGVLETNYDIAFKRLMLAVGAYQHSSDVNSFTSKRDYALQAELDCLEGNEWADASVCSHPDYLNSPGDFPLVGLTEQENYGHDLIYNITSELNPDPDGEEGPLTAKRAGCGVNCHRSGEDPNGLDLDERYADDRFHNIGTPANPEIPGDMGPDQGLAAHTGNERNAGQHKTPTLRNVDKRKDRDFIKAYTHNGWFKSLESLVHFYNTSNLGNCDIGTDDNGCTDRREVAYSSTTAYTFGITRCPEHIQTEAEALANNCWPAPEIDGIIPRGGPDAIGNLGLTLEDEAAVVAYMQALTDEYTPRAAKPWILKKLGLDITKMHNYDD